MCLKKGGGGGDRSSCAKMGMEGQWGEIGLRKVYVTLVLGLACFC